MVNTNKGYSEYSAGLQAQAAQELLQLLRQEEEVSYPWNPLAPESESFFAELEQEFTLEDWSLAEVETRSQAFFSGIDQLWPQNVPDTILQRLQASLSERFACRVPAHWLEAIATKTSELIGDIGYAAAPALSLKDQMVQCVQELLPNWAEEDLQVLARPLAYAMRGVEGEAVELALAAVRPVDWNELSEMERARLSLAIARVALAELETTDEL